MTNFDDSVLDGGTLAGVGVVGKKRLSRKEQKHAKLFKEQLDYLQKAGLNTKFIDNYIDLYNTKGWSGAQYWLMDEVDRLNEERTIGDVRNSVARKRRKMFKAPVDIAKEIGEGAWEGVKEVGKGVGNAFMAFGNALLAGESGPTASALYAAGNIYNPKTRLFEQTEENIEKTEGLRNNLAALAAGSVAAMAIPAAASVAGGATGGTTAAVSSFPTYTPYALTTAEKIGNFVVPVGLSMAAGEGFNDLTRATSGKTLAQEIGSYFPESVRPYAEFAGEFLNPGYILGGMSTGLLKKGINSTGKIGSNLVSKGSDKIIEPIKNTTFLIKLYGLKNPYNRKKLMQAIKTPESSVEYIKRFGVPTDIKRAVQDLPELLKLEQRFGRLFKPEYFMKDATPLRVRNTLNYAEALNNRYNKHMIYLEKNYPVLHNIAKESPQYTKKLFRDALVGRVDKVGLEPYVKNLIKESNTFLRRMNGYGTNFTPDDFLTIKGRGINLGPQTQYELHVGNGEVINGGNYGNIVYKYEPKNLKLKGPVETWWSQRKPEFKDIKVERGMHDHGDATGKYYDVLDIRLFNKFNKHLNDYLKTRNHVVFSTKTPGLSIGDKFIATPVTGTYLPHVGLGYKQGGKLIPQEI